MAEKTNNQIIISYEEEENIEKFWKEVYINLPNKVKWKDYKKLIPIFQKFHNEDIDEQEATVEMIEKLSTITDKDWNKIETTIKEVSDEIENFEDFSEFMNWITVFIENKITTPQKKTFEK